MTKSPVLITNNVIKPVSKWGILYRGFFYCMCAYRYCHHKVVPDEKKHSPDHVQGLNNITPCDMNCFKGHHSPEDLHTLWLYAWNANQGKVGKLLHVLRVVGM